MERLLADTKDKTFILNKKEKIDSLQKLIDLQKNFDKTRWSFHSDFDIKGGFHLQTFLPDHFRRNGRYITSKEDLKYYFPGMTEEDFKEFVEESFKYAQDTIPKINNIVDKFKPVYEAYIKSINNELANVKLECLKNKKFDDLAIGKNICKLNV